MEVQHSVFYSMCLQSRFDSAVMMGSNEIQHSSLNLSRYITGSEKHQIHTQSTSSVKLYRTSKLLCIILNIHACQYDKREHAKQIMYLSLQELQTKLPLINIADQNQNQTCHKSVSYISGTITLIQSSEQIVLVVTVCAQSKSFVCKILWPIWQMHCTHSERASHVHSIHTDPCKRLAHIMIRLILKPFTLTIDAVHVIQLTLKAIHHMENNRYIAVSRGSDYFIYSWLVHTFTAMCTWTE